MTADGPNGASEPPAVVYLAGQADRDPPLPDAFDLTLCTSPATVQQQLREAPPDCLVVEHDPPAVDGPTVFASLPPSLERVPSVLFDTAGDPAAGSEAVAAGADGFLPAPSYESPGRELADRVDGLAGQSGSDIDPWGVFDAAGDGILVHGIDSEAVLDCNEAFAEMLGYARSELIGMSVSSFSADDQPTGRTPEENVRVAAEQESFVFEWINLTRDGERVPVEVNPTLTEVRGERRVVSLVRDISDRKRREHTLETLQQGMEELIRAETPPAVCEATTAAAEAVLDYPAATAYLYDETADCLRPVSATPGVTDLIGEPPVFDGSGSLTWEAFEAGEVRRYEELDSVEGAKNPETDVGSEVILPLGEHGVLLAGVPAGQSLADRDLELTRLLARAAETALDRVEREREAERRERQLEAIVENSTDAVMIKDTEGRYQLVNETLASYHGVETEALLGVTAAEVFDDEGTVWEREREVLETGETKRYEQTVPVEDGEHVFDIVRAPYRGPDGEIRGIIGIGRDISERRERERRLETFESAIEASVDGIAVLDTSGTHWYINAAYADLYGYDDPGDLEGRDWRSLYTDDEVERFESEVQPALEERGSWTGETVCRRDDGSTFPAYVSLSRLDEGRVVAVVRDITDREARRRALREKNERLERFSAVVSHDLRSPLQSARAELALIEADTETAYTDDLSATLDRLENIVEEVLALAEGGEDVLEPRPVDLGSLAEAAWRTAGSPDATLRTDSLGTIEADPARTRRLLENLFRNSVEHGSTGSRPQADDAIEHGSTDTGTDTGPQTRQERGEDGFTRGLGESGGDAVTVSVRGTEEGDGFVVADDGSGLPASDRERVFERGFTTGEAGSGLGLDIVRRIAERHGWSVTVDESEAGGARFVFSEVDRPDDD